MDIKRIQSAFMQFNRRAEGVSQDILTKTFVDAEPLFIQLSSKNHQILYGRRGTGKTHALKFLMETVIKKGGAPVYIDLRVVGSNGAIYSDPGRPITERATRLLTDVLVALESELIQIAVAQIDSSPDPKQISLRIDDLAEAIRAVEVRGSIEKEETTEDAAASQSDAKAGVSLDPSKLKVSADVAGKLSSSIKTSSKTKTTGRLRASIAFGTLQSALSGLLAVLGSPEVWLLIDEWSEIPSDLQPYLADLLRRTVLPQKNIVVKIAAIEHRSKFAIRNSPGDYIGLEIGADVTADINLDDFVVYDVDQKKALEFYKSLIFKHYVVSETADAEIKSADDLIAATFTQVPVFQEFVRAVEGVPRDALNLAALIARISFGRKIAIEDVRKAAREWYQQDKMAVTKANVVLADVLNFIISEVIERRRTRAFLFPTGQSNPEIDQLYDARLLHVLKKSIASKDEPGRRYDVFKIDYGCYVDLINTTKSPLGLLSGEETGSYIDVPPDDYRSIRRAILRPDELAKALSEALETQE